MTRTLGTMALLVVGVLLGSATVTQAQQNCAPREVVIDRLASAYGETRRSIGLGQNNAVIEVFASTETGSWTITVTSPAGVTCLVASGLAFETLNEALPVPTEDA